MRSFIRTRPITAFLVIAYILVGAVFALPLLSEDGLGVIPVDLPGVGPFIVVAAFALLGAAFATTSAADGRPGSSEYRRRLYRIRVNPVWFAVGLALLPWTAVLTATLLTGTSVIAELVSNPAILLGIVVEALVAFALVNWWEEAAFTGFLLQRLQPRMGPIRASVVTTWAQAFVHIPLLFVVDGVTNGRVPTDELAIFAVALFVLPIPVRIIITWLYNASGYSIPVVGLFHAGLGVATGDSLIPLIAPGFAPLWVYAGFAVVALIVSAATKGRLGYEPAVVPGSSASELEIAEVQS